jgi:hypothetical protein
MGWKATIKAIQASERREQREAQKHLRALQRQLKEQAKLSALEQARLEVEAFDGVLNALLTVHEERGELWDWIEIAAALPPHKPIKLQRHELKAKQQAELRKILNLDREASSLEEARAKDEAEFQTALRTYAEDLSDWEKMRVFARRILSADLSAYKEAVVQFSGLGEISELGSSIGFTIRSSKVVECNLTVSGLQCIPAEQKTLTAAGKLSVKPMPKTRFHEIYQDYVCGCVLRVAREVFALLPVEWVLITALIDMVDSRSGQTEAQPVLSVGVDRAAIQRFIFEKLDPSDAIETLLHRGDAKASRRSGEFTTIAPLTVDDLPQCNSGQNLDCGELIARLLRLRDEIKTKAGQLTSVPAVVVLETSEMP